MIRRPTVFLLLLAAGCGTSWEAIDADGDGYTRQDGDCWDAVEGPQGFSGADIHPEASETFYDGIDQNCDGRDDYDQDGDGWVPDEMSGLTTLGVPGSGALPPGDCWDLPGAPDGSEIGGAEIHPEASETFYDGLDQDCDQASDFDADADGYDSLDYSGEDCDDNDAGVHPGATEIFYDGTDQDCDDNDCDQDGDGYDADGSGLGVCDNDDCDDLDASIMPDDDATEIWYNGVDENCDNNDGDQDGDGYWADDYEAQVASAGGEPLPIPDGMDGDCDDSSDIAYPGAAEVWYDGQDQDCLGGSDYDADLDGFDSADHSGEDCDDSDATIRPDAAEIFYDGTDQDCDGLSDYDADQDGFDSVDYSGEDCDDSDATIRPDAAEIFYDGTDQDCDGLSDYDADQDGFDSVDYSGEDCDDSDATIRPDATEIFYDGTDQDCDGLSDYDADLDGFDSVDYDGDDCDDTRSGINPDAVEAWDGADNDCNGLTDDMLASDVALGWLGGSAAGDQLGFDGALSYGDIDDDGVLDLMFGSTTALDASGALATGAVWIVGARNPLTRHGPAEDYALHSIYGTDEGGLMAVMGPRAGDVTGDGIDDICIGGTDATDRDNSALVVFAGGMGLPGVLTPSAATLELQNAMGSEPPVLLSHLDMNADGVAELLYADWSGSGTWGYTGSPIYLIEPASLSGSMDLDAAASDYLFAWHSDDQPGRTMGGADLDGDGYDDLILGAPGADGGDGLIAIYQGSSPLPNWSGFSDYSDEADLLIAGDTGSLLGQAGHPAVCDLDDDGTQDLVVASPGAATVYVFLDIASSLGTVLDLSLADIQISGESGSLFGYALQTGDLNGDALDDLLIGAPGSDDPGSPSDSWNGAVYLFEGSGVIGLATASTAQASATLTADQASMLGAAIIVPDTDGDGSIDPILAAPTYDDIGRAWLIPSL